MMKVLYKPHTVVYQIPPEFTYPGDIKKATIESIKEFLNHEKIISKVKKQASIELMARYEIKPLYMIIEPWSYTRENQMDFISVEASWAHSNRYSRLHGNVPSITVTYFIKAVILEGSESINRLKLKDPKYVETLRIEDINDN